MKKKTNLSLQEYIEAIKDMPIARPKAEFSLFSSVSPEALNEVIIFLRKS